MLALFRRKDDKRSLSQSSETRKKKSSQVYVFSFLYISIEQHLKYSGHNKAFTWFSYVFIFLEFQNTKRPCFNIIDVKILNYFVTVNQSQLIAMIFLISYILHSLLRTVELIQVRDCLQLPSYQTFIIEKHQKKLDNTVVKQDCRDIYPHL